MRRCIRIGICNRKTKIESGEFIVQMQVPESDTKLSYACIKKTRFSKIEYPLVSVAAVRKEHQIRMALSGICGYPFRSVQFEEVLNDQTLSMEDRIEKALVHLPDTVVNDFLGSDEYRKFILRHVLTDLMQGLERG